MALKAVPALFVAPLAGALAGALLVFVAAPELPQFAVLYSGVGFVVALVATVVLGVPAALLARQPHVSRLPWFVGVSLFGGVAFAFAVACATGGCFRGSWVLYFLCVLSAVVTAVVFHLLLPRHRAL